MSTTVEAAPVSAGDNKSHHAGEDVSNGDVSGNNNGVSGDATTPSNSATPAVLHEAAPGTASAPTGDDPQGDFQGDVNTDDRLPSQAMLRKVQDVKVLDQDENAVSFQSLYEGPNAAQRVLIIFIRHFFCGNCQEYIRILTSSIPPPSALLQLPVPTSITIIGCGSPSFIPMYRESTGCPFPIYADPTRTLHEGLGMQSTLALGPRPKFQRKSQLRTLFDSIVQELRYFAQGSALRGGPPRQVGGEFLFEAHDPARDLVSASKSSDDAAPPAPLLEKDKEVTWCHRMRNTRDHAEIPVIRKVLGLDGVNEAKEKSNGQ
ncbi:MAG: hypothetical protein M1818_004081 [Claussenomyces sp. TS43310]|nr:MAG: hypothetical protein M1818_004081 [Claussenomyces sp. TS43310]